MVTAATHRASHLPAIFTTCIQAMAASMKSSLVLAVLCAAFSMCSCFHTCISSKLHTNPLCSTAASRSSKAACSSRRMQHVLMLQDSELEPPAVAADDEFADWTETGRKGRVLKRKKDTPVPEYTPQQVISQTCRAIPAHLRLSVHCVTSNTRFLCCEQIV
jgi:hypothetical protein